MSAHQEVKRDERTVAVENAGYKWACVFVTYALLIDMVCRGVFFHEQAWDLFALAIVPGAICFVYLARQKALPSWRPSWKAMLFVFASIIVGAAIAIILTMTHAM